MNDSTGLISVDGLSDKKPRRRHGENRERLIAAGIEQFGLAGYHGASTAAIGRCAEVSQPHVYANFANKQQLFLACLTRSLEILESTGQPEALARLTDTEDQLPAATARARLQASRMVYQAVSTAYEFQHELPQLRELLQVLRVNLGTRAFQQVLMRAADSLITEP